MIASMEEFSALLADTQAQLAAEVRCDFTPALSARMNDAALVEALITGLPMAQGIQHRIVRSRGRGVILTAKVRYRDAVRMLGGIALTVDESSALETAHAIARAALRLDGDKARFRYVYDWVCGHIRYVHTAPGQKGYEWLVGASGALLNREANCQGFADVLYLLCGLCGIECEYRSGRGEKRLHVWNCVWIDGCWQDADASRGARENNQRKTASP